MHPVEGGEKDAWAAWQGMPEFDNSDLSALQSIIVHFKTREDADEFSHAIGQIITEQTRSIWFPKAEIVTEKDKRYAKRR